MRARSARWVWGNWSVDQNGVQSTSKPARRIWSSCCPLAKDLDLLPTRSLPPTAAAGLAAVLRGVKGKLDEIDAFGIEQGDPATARDRLVGELRTATRDLQHEALICVPFLDYLNRRDSNPSSRLEEAVREAEVGAQDLQNALAERLAEAERVVDAIRSSAGEAGVASYAEQFQSEASSAQSRGRCWLGATVIAALAAVSFIVAYDSLAWPQQVESMSVLTVARLALTKVSVALLLVGATVWCGRQYRALTHQQTINRHRALSLRTVQAFVEGTTDEATKDAVRLVAANAVFANLPTGLVDAKAAHDPTLQIVDVGRSLSRRGGLGSTADGGKGGA